MKARITAIALSALMFAATSGMAQANITLRDAIYLCGQDLHAGGQKRIVGEDCDVFQLILDLDAGYSDLYLLSYTGNTVVDEASYPDRIDSNSAMFAYMLYGGAQFKEFIFEDKANSNGTAKIGSGSVFGYCLSADPAARVYLAEVDSCTRMLSDGTQEALPNCTPTPVDDGPAPVTPGCDDGRAVIGEERISRDIEIRNGSCTLDGTIVDGNVLVYSGGSLAVSGASILGNIQASGGVAVTVGNDAYVEGDIQLDGLTGGSSVSHSEVGGNVQLKSTRGAAIIDKNRIDGDIQFEALAGGDGSVKDNVVLGNIQLDKNRLNQIAVEINRVDGDIQIFENQGTVPISVESNIVAGNLQCKDNTPAPTGSANLVSGDKEDQCSTF